jgi:cobalt-zinc-cadmium efflux system protein
MHSHDHRASEIRTSRVLQFSLLITLAYIVLLVITGLKADSLALLSEAGHNVSDFLALLLSWVAVYLGGRPPSARKTFGYHRAGVIAAFINASSLVAIALLIFYQSWQRFSHPVDVQPRIMMWAAGAGVAINGLITFLLWRSKRDINLRSALIHEIGDTLSTAAVIAGGWAIMITGQKWIDPALSVAIGAMILWSSAGIIRESLNILLEGMPHGMELEQISSVVSQVQGVCDIHDLHVWSIGSDRHALAAHVTIADIPPSESDKILQQIRSALAQHFHIHHTTIQFEHVNCEVAHGCVIPIHENPHGHVH